MAAKRTPRTSSNSNETDFKVELRRADLPAVELPASIGLPKIADETVDRPAAPKAGPPVRGRGGSVGLGRGQVGRNRQYAFRRS